MCEKNVFAWNGPDYFSFSISFLKQRFTSPPKLSYTHWIMSSLLNVFIWAKTIFYHIANGRDCQNKISNLTMTLNYLLKCWWTYHASNTVSRLMNINLWGLLVYFTLNGIAQLLINPPDSEASREVANLTVKKKSTHPFYPWENWEL